MKLAILGSGFIARFYAESLKAQRRKDQIHVVYSRTETSAANFSKDYSIPRYTTSLSDAVDDSDVEVVIIALPNHLHLEAVEACSKARKHVLCTKPLGRTAKEAKHMVDLVEAAGIFGGYLEDLCYTPKFLKSLKSVQQGALGKILWTRSREAHPGPHSDWFWDEKKSGGGAMIDLACHCVEIGRSFIGKSVRPLDVMCWSATQVHPIEAEDHALGWVRYSNGAISQFEVSWTFRGGMDLRDEIMGTEGTIWLNHFLRTGFEMYTTGKNGYVAEKAESNQGWLFPVGDEAHELGYPNMFTDMFNAIEEKRQPQETFYDGYVVNAILDAAYASSKSGQWQPVTLEIWRGDTNVVVQQQEEKRDNTTHIVIKEEILPHGAIKQIIKNRYTGQIEQQIVEAHK